MYTSPQQGAATSIPGAMEGEFKNSFSVSKIETSESTIIPSLF